MCRRIGYSPVPLNNEQRFKFTMSTYTWAASLCDQRWTCVLWNQGVKWLWCGQASSQPAPEWYGLFLAVDRRDRDVMGILNLVRGTSSSMHVYHESSFSHTMFPYVVQRID